MKVKLPQPGLALVILLLLNCSGPYQATYIEANPRANTKSTTIDYQVKQQYPFIKPKISIDNEFSGARMNGCMQINDSTLAISIQPENSPINASPWYAFRIISQQKQKVYIQLNYQFAKHRYVPKIRYGQDSWMPIDQNLISLTRGDSTALFPVQLQADTTWVAAQEIITSTMVKEWGQKWSSQSHVEMKVFGQSSLGRDLFYLDVNEGKKKGKPLLIILARQHPPEITGHYAMEAFANMIMRTRGIEREFRSKYRTLIFPILNPDGVDLGHWRHNAGGVDLNRDWGSYHQPEIRQVADQIVKQVKKWNTTVVMGLDFHSTHYDIYYTNDVDSETLPLGDIKSEWLRMIDHELPDYSPNEEGSDYRPVATSKNWFYAELETTGIIYEVGDQTRPGFIERKAQIAAHTLMRLLLDRE